MLIRPIQVEDSGQFLALTKKIDQETEFMLLEPGERTTTIDEQRQKIKDILSRGNQIILVAEDNNALIGYLGAFGGNFQRNRHSAYLVVGLLQAYIGQGIGAQLFKMLEAWTLTNGIHRLELTVMAHNARAMRLYRKMGFKTEGIKRDSLNLKGKYVDEYYMAKLAQPLPSPAVSVGNNIKKELYL